MFSTVQKMTGERRGTMIFASRDTRVRFSALRSIFLDSLAAASTTTRPTRSRARKTHVGAMPCTGQSLGIVERDRGNEVNRAELCSARRDCPYFP
jgi:hypothetical protein